MAKDDNTLESTATTDAMVASAIAMMHAGAEQLRINGGSASVQYALPPELQNRIR